MVYRSRMTAAEFKAMHKHIGASGVQLAEWLGTTPQTITRWRSGTMAVPGPAVTALKALAEGWRP